MLMPAEMTEKVTLASNLAQMFQDHKKDDYLRSIYTIYDIVQGMLTASF